MTKILEKVTAFVIHRIQEKYRLLLIEHPYAGIQLPAGTVEADETPEAAALREATEETGLSALAIHRYLGYSDNELPEGHKVILETTVVYARPDTTSPAWVHLRRGLPVMVQRTSGAFTQVTYEEYDRLPDPQYLTLRITGWVMNEVLAETRRRHFFHLEYEGQPMERWSVDTDNHRFVLFWAPLTNLPELIYPQNEWLAFLDRHLLDC